MSLQKETSSPGETFSRLEHAKWVLERNLGWIAAAEVKAGTISAFDAALLGLLVALYAEHGWGVNRVDRVLAFAATAFFLLMAIYCVAACIIPRTAGPGRSLIYFGCVKSQALSDYDLALRSASEEELLDDCIAQVHRNAEIACEKYDWAKAATLWTLVGAVSWVLAVVACISG
jgi:hypothetical protein